MSRKNFKILSYFLVTIFFTLGLSISLQSLLAAWSGPTINPPDGNVSAPINESAVAQVKTGSLGLAGNLLVGTDNLFVNTTSGKVGVGTTNPGAKLQISAPASTEGLRLISASDWSPLNIRNSADAADIFRVDQNGDIRAGKTIYKDASGNVIIQLGN